MEHTNLAMPEVPSEAFVPPSLLFPVDRVAHVLVTPRTEWQDLGTGMQEKYRRKAWWIIEHSHVMKQDAETLAQAIYEGNPSLIAP